MTRALSSLSLILFGFGVPFSAFSADLVKPFAHEALQQEGRITLTPGFAPDGNAIYFAQSACRPIWECPQTLKVSTRTDTGWSAPRAVSLPISGRVDYPSVTPDGHNLLFSWNGTQQSDGQWRETANFDVWTLPLGAQSALPTRLQGEDLLRVRGGRTETLRYVNNEAAPILTETGELYFWSERLDVPGGRNVFMAMQLDDGSFSSPVVLPDPINSAEDDDGSWISPDGQTMLITYATRGGCGGSDLFIAYKTGQTWSDPKNLGCDINSEFDEGAGTLTPDGARIIFMSTRPMEGETGETMRGYSLWQAPFGVNR